MSRMRTPFKWINYGAVEASALAEFDNVRPGDVGRGAFLALLSNSEAGQAVDLSKFAGIADEKRVVFGRCHAEEYNRTRKGMMPPGVTRTGFLKAMTSVAGMLWED